MAIEFKATADYNAVVAELDKVRRANEALLAKQGDMKRGADDNEKAQVKAMRELERFAVQTSRTVQTANEKHQEQLEKLKKAFDANLLTAEQYGRAVEKANQDAAASYDEVAEKVDKVDDKQQQATVSTGGLADSVGKAVLGYLSFQAVLSKVGEALQWTREQTEKAMASFSGLDDERRKLAQIAKLDVAGQSLPELYRTVDDLAARYGEDRAVVARTMFSAVSEGFEGSMEDIAKYGDVVSMQSAATVAGQMPALFKAAGYDMTPMQAIAGTLAAAESSRLDFEQMAAVMPTVAQGVKMTGSSPTEALAIMSVLSSQFKSAEQAATVFRGYGVALGISQPIGGVSDEEKAKSQSEIEQSQKRILQLTESSEEKTRAIAARRRDLQEQERRLGLRLADDPKDRQAVQFDLAKVREQISRDIPQEIAKLEQQTSESIAAEQQKIASAEQKIASTAGVDLSKMKMLEATEALMGMPAEDRREFLKVNKELNIAYNEISPRIAEVRAEMAKLDAQMETVAAGGEHIVERKFRGRFDPSTPEGEREVSAEQWRQSKIAREIANEQDRAQLGFETGAAIDRAVTGMRGEASFGQFAVEKVGRGAETLTAGTSWSGAAVEAATGGAQRYFGGTESNLEFLGRNLIDAVLPLNALLRMATEPGNNSPDELLQEQRRQTEILERISQSGPRSGMSTLTQPQMSAQTIPR